MTRPAKHARADSTSVTDDRDGKAAKIVTDYFKGLDIPAELREALVEAVGQAPATTNTSTTTIVPSYVYVFMGKTRSQYFPDSFEIKEVCATVKSANIAVLQHACSYGIYSEWVQREDVEEVQDAYGWDIDDNGLLTVFMPDLEGENDMTFEVQEHVVKP